VEVEAVGAGGLEGGFAAGRVVEAVGLDGPGFGTSVGRATAGDSVATATEGDGSGVGSATGTGGASTAIAAGGAVLTAPAFACEPDGKRDLTNEKPTISPSTAATPMTTSRLRCASRRRARLIVPSTSGISASDVAISLICIGSGVAAGARSCAVSRAASASGNLTGIPTIVPFPEPAPTARSAAGRSGCGGDAAEADFVGASGSVGASAPSNPNPMTVGMARDVGSSTSGGGGGSGFATRWGLDSSSGDAGVSSTDVPTAGPSLSGGDMLSILTQLQSSTSRSGWRSPPR
jgi:hypothetical protein